MESSGELCFIGEWWPGKDPSRTMISSNFATFYSIKTQYLWVLGAANLLTAWSHFLYPLSPFANDYNTTNFMMQYVLATKFIWHPAFEQRNSELITSA